MHHKTKKLGDFCRTGSGGTPSRSQMDRYYEDGDIPWVKSGELREGLITSTEEHVTEAALKETSIKLVPAGAILLAMYGATVGRLAILGVEATTNQAVCHIVPNPDEADTRYLYHAISAQVPAIIAMGVGGAQPNISQGLIKDLKVWLPPLPEQRRIADILDRAEALRAKRREALAQLDGLAQSIFLEMFGDQVTNPKHWPDCELGSLILDGPQNGLYKPSSDYGDGTRILRIDAFYDGKVKDIQILKKVNVTDEEVDKYSLNENDIVINRVNSLKYLGKSAIIPKLDEPVVFESNMMRFSVNCNLINPVFLIYNLQSNSIKMQIDKSAKKAVNQASINQKDVCDFKIYLPNIELQDIFAKRIHALDGLRRVNKNNLFELNKLAFSIQHRAFRGEL